MEKYETLIIVKSCNIEYLKSAKFEARLQIYSAIESINKASFVMKQNIMKDDNFILKGKIKLVTVNRQGKPIRIPYFLEKKIL